MRVPCAGVCLELVNAQLAYYTSPMMRRRIHLCESLSSRGIYPPLERVFYFKAHGRRMGRRLNNSARALHWLNGRTQRISCVHETIPYNQRTSESQVLSADVVVTVPSGPSVVLSVKINTSAFCRFSTRGSVTSTASLQVRCRFLT